MRYMTPVADSTPYPEPDRAREAWARKTYTADFTWIMCRMPQPFLTWRFKMAPVPR